jgi:hypothetical protein
MLMKSLVLISLTCLVCLPTSASAETIKTTGIQKSLQAQFEYQLPCTHPKTGVPGVSSYLIFVRYDDLPESIHPTVLKGEAAIRIFINSSCSGDGYYDWYELNGYTRETILPGETTAFIKPNLKTGNLYIKVPLVASHGLCVYDATVSLNFEAISNPTNLIWNDKEYYTDKEKVIYHGFYREALAKATGQFTLKTRECFSEIVSPPSNYTAFPSTSAQISDLQYKDITIIKK